MNEQSTLAIINSRSLHSEILQIGFRRRNAIRLKCLPRKQSIFTSLIQVYDIRFCLLYSSLLVLKSNVSEPVINGLGIRLLFGSEPAHSMPKILFIVFLISVVIRSFLSFCPDV